MALISVLYHPISNSSKLENKDQVWTVKELRKSLPDNCNDIIDLTFTDKYYSKSVIL